MIATKEQERKALAQIRKIVDGLGKDSYVATAFKGCFEISEGNIENDFGLSMEDTYQDVLKQLDEAEEKIATLEERIRKTDESRARYEKQLEYEINQKDEENMELQEAVTRLQDESLSARRDIKISTADSDYYGPFKEIKFINNGFCFINVVQESGWTTSYRIEDITELQVGNV